MFHYDLKNGGIMEDNFKEFLIMYYGQQISKDIDVIMDKISVVVVAHKHAGLIGDNALCVINREMAKIIK
jgi:hypothetical protein